jgi:hypothetical protein
MQTHLVDFLCPKNQYPQNICTRTWFSRDCWRWRTYCRRNGFYNWITLFRFMVVIKNQR